MTNYIKSFVFANLLMFFSLISTVAMAHGTDIKLNVINGNQLEVKAQFSADEPMSNAQILVYAADNPQKVWLSGMADEKGYYVFDVDKSIAGTWAVSIRTAGHGELRHFVVEDNVIQFTQSHKRPFWQTLLLVVLILGVLFAIAKIYARPKVEATEAGKLEEGKQ